MNTEKLEKLEKFKKQLDNKLIPDGVKDKIRNEIENLESEIKSEDITATELKKEVAKVEEKVEMAVEKAEKKAESTEPKKGRGRPRKTPATTPVEPKATETAIKKTAMVVAKTIRKDGEKWNDAMKRANGVMKKEKVEVKKTTKSELDRLLARVRKNKSLMSELKDVKDLGRDAVRTAKPVGKRISEKGRKNGFGTTEGGNVYYEYRANKTDRKTYGKYAFELGGSVVTDLAGHTGGGNGGFNPRIPLDGFSNTAYTGLVGETGAMSSGEMFMAGGSVRNIKWANADNKKLGVWLLTSVDGNAILNKSKNASELEKNVMDFYKKRGSVARMTWDDDADEGLSWVTFTDLYNEIKSNYMSGGSVGIANQQVIDDASQSYVNYYLGQGTAQGIYKDGGAIMNQYEGKTPEQIWNMLSISQRYHFLHDHKKEIESTPASVEKATKTAYKFLPEKIKISFKNHIVMGQYATGGGINEKTNKMKKQTLKKGDNVFVVGRRWFDRANGNTYHTAEVEVNGEYVGKSRMTYGYGDNYLETAKEILLEKYNFPKGMTERSSLWQLREYGVVLNKSVIDGLKRDLEDGGFMDGVYAKGGGVRQIGNREYSYGRNWTNDHEHVNKSEEHEVNYTRKGKFLGVFAKGGGVRQVGNREYSLGRNWTNDQNHVNKSEEHELNYTRKKKFNDGGAMQNFEYDDVLEVLKEKLEGAIDELPMDYENSDSFTGEEVEKKSRDGFIAFTDGGYEVNWFEYISMFTGSGKSLPTKPLDTEMERQVAYNYEYAKERFVEEYPEIVEELGEDNIDYNSLYEAGYGDEAEQLSEWEMDFDGNDTIFCEIGAYYYDTDNSRGIDEKHTLRLFGYVNLESPYHRRGNLDDSYDIDITFDSISELKEKVDAGLKEIIDWFDGKYYNDSTTEMKIRRMADGGFMDGVYAKGGAVSPFKNMMETNTITEKEINLIKLRMNNDKVDEYTQEAIDFIWDNSPQLTPEQNKKGIEYLRNLWKSPTGKERVNSPFGYREEEALETFEYFELRGFYDAGNRYNKFYVPLYVCVGAETGFEYYTSGGNINIVG